MAIPKQYAMYLNLWLEERKRINLEHSSIFVNSHFGPITGRICSNYVETLSLTITGLVLSPVDFRHIRATHFYHSVNSKLELEIVERGRMLENYAASVGHTVEVMKNHYVYFNPKELAVISSRNTEAANEFIADGLNSPLEITL